jgi:hypothetical protein
MNENKLTMNLKKTQCICWLEQNKDCQNVEKFIIRIENAILETVEVPVVISLTFKIIRAALF